MQRWFAADARAGDPYILYAASNLGSFAGLISYPAIVEPSLPLAAQSWGWTAGYALLVLLVAASAARSEEHTSELQSLMRSSYAVFCFEKKNTTHAIHTRSTKYSLTLQYITI